MAESELWRELAKEFRALQAKPDVRYPPSFASLRADWSDIVGGKEATSWSFSGGLRSTEVQFDALARRAGRLLWPPANGDLCDAWLNHLRSFLRDNFGLKPSGQGTYKTGTGVVETTSGSIEKVCEESANLCSVLEGNAIEAERYEEERRKGQVQPVASPAIVTIPLSPEPTRTEAKEPKRKPRRRKRKKALNAAGAKRSRKAMSDRYFAAFPEKISVLDVCWAAKQPYREWRRWINAELNENRDAIRIKDGSKPDRAFRAILQSRKRPEAHRKEPRPPKWIGGAR